MAIKKSPKKAAKKTSQPAVIDKNKKTKLSPMNPKLKFPKKSLPKDKEILDISIIITTFNEVHYTPLLLDSIMNQVKYYPK